MHETCASSLSFTHLLNDVIDIEKNPENYLFVTMDVTALYTNIPHIQMWYSSVHAYDNIS